MGGGRPGARGPGGIRGSRRPASREIQITSLKREPASEELLASVCQGLGLAADTDLRFYDEEGDQVLLR